MATSTHMTTELPPHRPLNARVIFAVVIWAALLVVGLQGLYDRLAFVSLRTDLGSWIPWGLWVASYIWFIGLSAGAFLLSTLVYVFGMKQLERVAPLALFVALVTLIMALLMIAFDVGHMGRLIEVWYRGNPHSMMAWMGWLYISYFVLLVIETYFVLRGALVLRRARPGLTGVVARLLTGGRSAPLTETEVRRDRRVVMIFGGIGIPLAFAFHGGVGALFATVDARDVWHTGLYPVLFLSGAFFSGGALFTGLVAFFWPNRDDAWRTTVRLLGRVTLGLLLLEALFEWADLSVPMWYGVGQEVGELHYMMAGPFWWVFWIVQIGLGLALPALLLFFGSRSPRIIGTAGLLAATAFLGARLNLVLPGLNTPELTNLQLSYHDGRLLYHYAPTWSEWELVLFIIALGIALYTIGVRVLPVLGRDGE